MERTQAKWEGSRACVFDTEEYEHVLPLNPILFQDDFLGAWTAIPDVGVGLESGCVWAKKTVETLGAPSVAIVANGANGYVQISIDATAEPQGANLYMADDRRFNITQGVVFETRIKGTVDPTLLGEGVWGLVGDWAAPDAITYSVFFTVDGSGEIFCEKDDNDTDQSATSGVTGVITEWNVFRIDCRDVTDIKFFINGNRVASGTTFPYIATGANATLQPFFAIYKSGGAGLGTMQVDYVRIWGNRS